MFRRKCIEHCDCSPYVVRPWPTVRRLNRFNRSVRSFICSCLCPRLPRLSASHVVNDIFPTKYAPLCVRDRRCTPAALLVTDKRCHARDSDVGKSANKRLIGPTSAGLVAHDCVTRLWYNVIRYYKSELALIACVSNHVLVVRMSMGDSTE